jgi:hypothetical protein
VDREAVKHIISWANKRKDHDEGSGFSALAFVGSMHKQQALGRKVIPFAFIDLGAVFSALSLFFCLFCGGRGLQCFDALRDTFRCSLLLKSLFQYSILLSIYDLYISFFCLSSFILHLGLCTLNFRIHGKVLMVILVFRRCGRLALWLVSLLARHIEEVSTAILFFLLSPRSFYCTFYLPILVFQSCSRYQLVKY